MPSPLSSVEQIAALLTGRAFSVVRDLYGGRQLSGTEYQDVFTVTRDDVVKHVKQQGFPAGAFSTRPRLSDGPYLIEDEGGFVVYYQERGIPFDEQRFSKRTDAEVAMVSLLLGLSGTGLYGDVQPFASADGYAAR